MSGSDDARVSARTGVFFVACASIGYSISLVMARILFDAGSNAPTLMTLRTAVLVLVLILWTRRFQVSQPSAVGPRTGDYLVGVLLYVGVACYLGSVAFIPVSLAVLIFYTFPLVTALIEAVRDRRRPSTVEVLSLVLAFVGIAIALNVEAATIDLLGVALALGASLGIALHVVGSSIVLRDQDTASASLRIAVGALLCALAVTALTGTFSMPAGGAREWGVFALMMVAFVAAFVAGLAGIRRVGARLAALIMNLEPVATIFLAVLVLDEYLTGRHLVGALLVLLAICLPRLARARALPGPAA